MKKDPIISKHNHWYLTKNLCRLMRTCKDESTKSQRYAIEGILADENRLVATDGRRLLVLDIPHSIQPNVYKIVDGWLIGPMEGSFPRYKDIIPSKQKRKCIYKKKWLRPVDVQKLLVELANAGWLGDMRLLLPVLDHLESCSGKNYEFFVHNSSPNIQPFLMTCECRFGQIQYLQMGYTGLR